MGLWQRLRQRFRRGADLFNLVVEPAYAIRASARNPYFQSLERRARQAGFLGAFVVDAEGRLRPGTRDGLPTLRARIALDVYPNPAAIEQRSVADYETPGNPRRAPRATLVLEDESELYIWPAPDGLRVQGAAVEVTRDR